MLPDVARHRQEGRVHVGHLPVAPEDDHANRVCVEPPAHGPLGLFGPRQRALQLMQILGAEHLILDLSRQHLEDRLLIHGQVPGRPVDDAQGSEAVALGRDQRDPGIEADVGGPGDEWVVRETLIDRGVPDDERLRPHDGVGAEGHFARRLGRVQPDAGLEPLPEFVHQAHEGDRHAAQARGQRGQLVEPALRGRVEDRELTQGSQSRRLVGGRRGNRLRRGRGAPAHHFASSETAGIEPLGRDLGP